MKRSVSIVAQCLLFLSSVAAYGAPPALGSLPSVAKTIFVAVPNEFRQAGTNSLEVIVELKGVVAVREQATFQNPPDPAVAVEILSCEPAELLALLLSAAQGDDAQVTVAVNDRSIVYSLLSALAADGTKALRAGAAPLKLDGSHLTLHKGRRQPAIGISGYLACSNACWNYWQTCNSYCTSRPIPNCETRCDNRLNNCLAQCPCPTTSTYDEIQYLDTLVQLYCAPAGNFGCDPGQSGYPANQYQEITKTLHHLRSENCDGSVSDTVTSVDYSQARNCWGHVNTLGSCYPTECFFGRCFGR